MFQVSEPLVKVYVVEEVQQVYIFSRTCSLFEPPGCVGDSVPLKDGDKQLLEFGVGVASG